MKPGFYWLKLINSEFDVIYLHNYEEESQYVFLDYTYIFQEFRRQQRLNNISIENISNNDIVELYNRNTLEYCKFIKHNEKNNICVWTTSGRNILQNTEDKLIKTILLKDFIEQYQVINL